MVIKYQLQMKSQALRLGHRTPQPWQGLDWILHSRFLPTKTILWFLAAYEHKYMSVFEESSLRPAQPSLLSGEERAIQAA